MGRNKYKGKTIKVPDFDNKVMVGDISGHNGNGIPIYSLHDFDPLNGFMGKKLGELNEMFIIKYLGENNEKSKKSKIQERILKEKENDKSNRIRKHDRRCCFQS